MWGSSTDYIKNSSVFKMAWPSAVINHTDFAEELWLHEIFWPLSKKFMISTLWNVRCGICQTFSDSTSSSVISLHFPFLFFITTLPHFFFIVLLHSLFSASLQLVFSAISTSTSSLATLISTLSLYTFHLQFCFLILPFTPLFSLLWLPYPPLPLFFFNFSL